MSQALIGLCGLQSLLTNTAYNTPARQFPSQEYSNRAGSFFCSFFLVVVGPPNDLIYRKALQDERLCVVSRHRQDDTLFMPLLVKTV